MGWIAACFAGELVMVLVNRPRRVVVRRLGRVPWAGDREAPWAGDRDGA
jgi:hypothetical protein